MASGKGLTSVALQIHDLIQELLLTENDTELLVDELTRFSPNLREKYTVFIDMYKFDRYLII